MRIYQLIIISVLLLAATSCSSVKKVKTQYENGTLMEEYYVSKKDPTLRHGSYFRYDESANLLESSNYINGVIDGQRKLYYANGQIMILETRMNGNFHGPYISYFASGNKNEEGSYTDNQMSGEWKYYYDLEDNPVKEEVQFRDNMENGPFREYHENGELKAEGIYKDEYENGLYREYNDRGTMMKEILYENGRPLVYKEFDKDGKIIKESDYRTGE